MPRADRGEGQASGLFIVPGSSQRFIKLQEYLCVSAPLREANLTVSRAEAQRRRDFCWCKHGITHQPNAECYTRPSSPVVGLGDAE